jgi:hypothetical protein
MYGYILCDNRSNAADWQPHFAQVRTQIPDRHSGQAIF